MKRFAILSIFFVGIFASLSAQNKSYSFILNDPEPPFNYINPYIGGNIGYASHTAHRNDLDGFLTDNSGWSAISSGFTGGAQVGFDWVRKNILLGMVGDWNSVNITSILDEQKNTTTPNLIKNHFEWISTIRAKMGVSVGSANIYVSGGAACAKFSTTWRDEPLQFSEKNSPWGWTGGAGADFKLFFPFSLGMDILYAHFENKNYDFVDLTTIPTITYAFSDSDSVWMGRLILNINLGDFFN